MVAGSVVVVASDGDPVEGKGFHSTRVVLRSSVAGEYSLIMRRVLPNTKVPSLEYIIVLKSFILVVV